MPKIPIELAEHPHKRLLIYLDEKYQELSDSHYKNAPPSGTVPAGGGEWMDSFFRMEAVRGCMTALRLRKSVEDAVLDGYAVSEISVQIWNTRRKKDYQTQRWEKTAHDYLDSLIRLFKQLEEKRNAKNSK